MNNKIINNLIADINKSVNKNIKIMEICGTHTYQIAKYGLKSLLTDRIQLISGPGCPVCVTNEDYIDSAIYILKNNPITIATFGDLMRVKGSEESLQDMKSDGYDVIIIHSPLDIIAIAEQNRNKTFVLLCVGFETTAPIIALTIKKTAEQRIRNLFFLTSLKLMEPVLHYILMKKNNQIDGFICPGHVASIKGSNYFRFISELYQKPAVVTGFEAFDIVAAVHFLVKNINCHESDFENHYKRCVTDKGNIMADTIMDDVFESSNGLWRGIGELEHSSFKLKKKYEFLDARNTFQINLKTRNPRKVDCQCSDVLLGLIEPYQCCMFAKGCTPIMPQGPCMVSQEGACAIAYKFREDQV